MIILPINNDIEVLKEIRKLAKEDGDDLFYPSHYAVEDGQIIGAFAVETPTSSWWMSKKKGNAKKTMLMLNSLETLHSENGNAGYIMPCSETSPYFKMMDKFGFNEITDPFKLFYKSLYPFKV